MNKKNIRATVGGIEVKPFSYPGDLEVGVAAGETLDKLAAIPSHDRRQSKSSAVSPQLTIAQCIRRSKDPHRAAVTSFTRRDCPHGQNKHIYYFEDGSFLTFEVSYTAVEDGGR